MGKKSLKPPEHTEKQDQNLVMMKTNKGGSDTVLKDVADILENINKWKKIDVSPIETERESARSLLGKIVFWSLAGVVGAFVVTGCIIATFFDIARIEGLVKVIQVTAPIITSIAGFVGGYYFSNKN